MKRETDDELVHVTTSERMRHRVLLRVVALLGLALMCLSFPSIGEHRHLLAVILLVMLPIPAVLPKVLPPEKWMIGQSCFDVWAVSSMIWLIPNVWAAGLVILVASPAASSPLLGRRLYTVIEGLGLVSVGAAAIVTGVEGFFVPWLVAVIMVPLVSSYVDVFLAEEHTARAQLGHVASTADVIFWEVDPENGVLLGATGRVKEILGYEPGEPPVALDYLIHPEDRARLASLTADDAGRTQGRCRLRHRDGSWVWMRLSFRQVGSKAKRTVRGVGLDINELVALAETDDLTGLANRAVLNRTLVDLLESQQGAALLIMDLDRFKEVNDTLGHHSGDRFLQEVAQRIDGVVGEHGLAARVGGDEFAVLTSGGDVRSAVEFARSIDAAMQQSVRLDGLDFAASVSIGIAVAPQHGNTTDELLRHADLAMYAAKRAGVAFRVYDSSTPGPTVDRLTLSSDVERALDRGELRLWYQPKVDLRTGRTIGAEGLLRWHHPERGVLRPKDFLDVVEISRHFPALTEELVAQAIGTLTSTTGHPKLKISVNVSVRNLADPGFSAFVLGKLRDAGVDASRLILEITEREIMDDRANLEATTKALRDAGVGLSVDDFGTGYSSLLRLHQLPITELKIDRRFISALGAEPEARIITQGVIEMGQRLGHTIVAEGVEQPGEVETLLELGCDIGQGFLWSPAVPEADFVAILGQTFTASSAHSE